MVEILDSTLREGEQTPFVNFMVEEKVEIARMLDRMGVDMIEAGDPSVSPNVFQAVKRIAGMGLRAEIVAHSLATKGGIEQGEGMRGGSRGGLLPDIENSPGSQRCTKTG